MECMLKKNLNSSYLILWNSEKQALLGYEQEMIRKNNIPALLPLEVVNDGLDIRFRYDITGRQSLASIYAVTSIGIDIIRSIIESVINVSDAIKEYMLDEAGILFDPDFIYYDKDSKGYLYCYYQEEDSDVFKGLHSLSEYILERLDHKDVRATKLAYMFYEITNKDSFYIGEIKELLAFDRAPEIAATARPVEQEVKEVLEDDSIEDLVISPEEIKKQKKQKRSWIDYLIWILATGIAGWILYDNLLKAYLPLEAILGGGVVLGGILGLLLYKRKEKRSNNAENEASKHGDCNNGYRDYQKTSVLMIDEQAGILLTPLNDSGLEDIRVSAFPYVIGTSRELADGRIDRDYISRTHFRLSYKEGRYLITDLDSTNGTFLNGEALTAGVDYQLNQGDVIRLGQVEYKNII